MRGYPYCVRDDRSPDVPCAYLCAVVCMQGVVGERGSRGGGRVQADGVAGALAGRRAGLQVDGVAGSVARLQVDGVAGLQMAEGGFCLYVTIGWGLTS